MSENSFENPYLNSAEIANEIKRAAIAKMSRNPKAKVVAPGRRCALMAIDAIMSRPDNIQRLYDAMQERMEQDPLGFHEQFVVPLMPKSAIQGDDDLHEGTEADGNKKTVIVLPSNGRGPITVDGKEVG